MSRAAGASPRSGVLRPFGRSHPAPQRTFPVGVVPDAVSVFAILVGAAVLLGWALEVQWLRSIKPGWGSIKPNTALAFVLAGFALAALRRPSGKAPLRLAARLCAAVVAVAGVLTLSEYLFQWDARIDQLLFQAEARPGGWSPGRMAPESALGFALLGLGLLLLDVEPARGPVPSDYFAVAVAAIAYIPILGYAYGARALWGIAPNANIALHAAIVFFLLAVGLLYARAGRGVAALTTSPHLGGQLARRLLPACVLIPALLGLVRLRFEARGFYAPAVGTALLVASVTAVFSAITASIAATLNRTDEERHRSQERAEEERGRLEAVLEQMPAGVVIAEAPSGRVVMGNRRAEQVFGHPATDRASLRHGQPHASSQRGASLLRGRDWGLSQALQTGDTVHDQEVEILRGDGSRGWILNTAAPIRDRQGRVVAAVAAFLDITQRKELEHELRGLKDELEERVRSRTTELTAANQELEAFAYSVSHDLRAPLRWINGFSEALVEEYTDRLDERGRQYLRDIRESTQHMGRLIDDLLHLSRVTRVEIVRESVDVSSLARDVASQIRRRDPRPTADLTIAEGLTAVADRSLLRVLLANLLGNAWKFTQPRAVPRIEVGETELDEGRAFFVRDNGVGFDMAYASRLFRPFERLHKLSDFEGTGIGLALVRRIVERHGGHVWAESELDRGATFYFTLGPRGEPA